MLSFQPNTYSRPAAAAADWIVHCTGQRNEIKKRIMYLLLGYFNRL